jgi:lysophospholipase L1-like esterase
VQAIRRTPRISGRALWPFFLAFLLGPLALARPASADRGAVIVFFGDSLTAGLHASTPDTSYRQLLLKRLAGTRDAGTSFAFIQDPLGLLDDAQTKVPLVLAARPTLIFLELGHHEIWADETQVARFESRYADILDRLLRSGADVVPSTLAWLGAEPGSFAYDASLHINDTIRRLSDERGLVVADLWSLTERRPELLSRPEDISFVEPYSGDDLHPNDAGHHVLADAFWDAYCQLRLISASSSRRPV